MDFCEEYEKERQTQINKCHETHDADIKRRNECINMFKILPTFVECKFKKQNVEVERRKCV